MIGKTTNPLLQKTQQAIVAKVPPDKMNAFQRIVKAGTIVMDEPKMHEMILNQLNGPGDPAELVGAGTAKLLGILFNQSKGTMPMEAAIPAATVLMCEGLGILEEVGKVKITPEFLAQCTQEMGSSVLQLFGVTPDKLQGILNKAGNKMPGAQPPAAPAPGGIIAGAAAQPQGAV